MKWVILAARLVLGLGFVVFGVQHFKPFLKFDPPPMTEAMQNLFMAFSSTGFLDVVKILEIIGGALVLTGIFLPLGLVILTPILVNIFLIDMLFMGKPGLGTALLVIDLFLIWAYRSYFKPLFTLRARPGP